MKRASSGHEKVEDYKLLSRLGKGGFGTVYKAYKESENKVYALKAIRKDMILKQEILKRVITEAKIALKLEHPFLIKTHCIFQDKTRVYLLMDYYKDGTLLKFIKKKQRLPEIVVLYFAAQMVSAVDYLHEQEIIHRDLKLENILFDTDGYLKIIDFGLSKFLPYDDMTFSDVGTEDLVAPEIITGEGHTYTVDWWEVGIITYLMLYGFYPFYDEDQGKKFKNIVKAEIRFPSSI